MVNNINYRTEEIIKLLDMNPNSFAEYIGVAPTVIYNIIGSRKSKPSFELIEKITSKVENLNINWYIKGTGSAFGNEPPKKIYLEDRILEAFNEIDKLKQEMKVMCLKIGVEPGWRGMTIKEEVNSAKPKTSGK